MAKTIVNMRNWDETYEFWSIERMDRQLYQVDKRILGCDC